MTSNRKEVCLDCSQGMPTVGTEQSKRDSIISNKDNSGLLIDASCQANIDYEVITYDSDDEMVKTRRGIPFGGLRNKRGHPKYSREDIREQYCITRKELDVFERSLRDSSAARLFGCLSTSHLPDSHCNKSSFHLLSCVSKRKNSSEADESSDIDKRPLNSQTTSTVSEEDDSDGGFRQYSVKRSHTKQSSDQRFNHLSNELKDDINRHDYREPSAQPLESNRSRAKVKFHQSNSFDSQDINRSSIRANTYAPKDIPYDSSTSHSVDELADYPTTGKQLWSASQRNGRTSELSEMSSKKHVSFDLEDSQMRRSLTCGSSIAGIQMSVAPNAQYISRQQQNQRSVSSPSISLTSTSSARRDSTSPVAIRERLLGINATEIDGNPLQPLVSPSQSHTPSVPNPFRLVRGVVTKTQATQTEVKNLVSNRSTTRSIPAYLILSLPSTQRRSFDFRGPTSPISLNELQQTLILRPANRRADSSAGVALPLIKSRSVHGIMINATNIDFNDEDVMQVCISGNDYNQMKTSKSDDNLKSFSDVFDEPFLHVLKPKTKPKPNLSNSIPKQDSDQETVAEGQGTDLISQTTTKDNLKLNTNYSKKKMKDPLVSPESESSSFQITSSTSSSHKIDENFSRKRISQQKGRTEEVSTSPRSQTITDPTSEEKKTSEDSESMKMRGHPISSIKRTIIASKTTQVLRFEETPEVEKHSSSSSETSSVHRSSHSPESIASTHFSANVEDLDSDLLDFTQDMHSSDQSTAVEQTTVIEKEVQTKPKIPPKPSYLCVDQKKPDVIPSNEAEEDVESKSIDSEIKEKDSEPQITLPEDEEDLADEEDVVDEPSGGALPFRRCLSGELSTVSEVSEEISCNGMGLHNGIISAQKINGGMADLQVLIPSADVLSSENNTIHSGATSPSVESTTSGSFIIDGSITPPSVAESDRIPKDKVERLESGAKHDIPNGIPLETEGKAIDTLKRSKKTKEVSDLDQKQSILDHKSEHSILDQISCDIRDSFDGLIGESHQKLREGEGMESQKSTEKESDEKEDEESQESGVVQEISTSESTTTQHMSDHKRVSEEENVSNISVKSEKPEKKSKRKIKRLAVHRNSSTEGYPILSQEALYLMERRARSLSLSPDKALISESKMNVQHQFCKDHHLKSYEKEEPSNRDKISSKQDSVPSILKRSRIDRTGIPYLYRKSMTIGGIYFNSDDEEEDAGVHTDSYRSAHWIYIGRKEEMSVWGPKNSFNNIEERTLPRSESDESTLSEKGFRKHFEDITHRLIHRKASIEMYKRILNNTFVTEKSLTLVRNDGEFGFRIHGSRPVVVSAIEKGKPADVCGLEVGDIVVTVNDTNVLEASHSEVVKLAHTGSDTLKLEVVSTAKSVEKNQPPVEHDILMNGYLSRLTDKLVDKQRDDSQTHGTNKLWRRRWYVLKSDYCLYWYRSPKSTEPMGAVSLHGFYAGVSNKPLFNQSFVFRLVRYATPQKYFAASDAETAGQWVNALNHSATRINQIDPYIDTTLYNIHKNPLSLKFLDCFGYLGKFSRRRKVWRHRYFVLKDACLYFYSDANSNTALGVFYLHGYKVQSCSMIGKKLNTFEVIPPDPKFRHLWLLSESDADKKRWLAALEYSIERWIRLK